MGEFQIRDVRVVYEGSPIQRLEVHHVVLPNGVERRFELIRHPGASAIVPLHRNGDVVLLRQLRYAADQSRIYELPAGKLSPGEAPLHCAERELEEETGLKAGKWTELFPAWMTPGFCDERIWLYLAEDLAEGRMEHEEDEVIEVLRVPFGEALAMIDRGEIRDAKTVCGLAAAAIRMGRLR